ncbi:MAG: S41 family peptidase, partial [Fimbriimonadaceae bacterium]
AAAMGTGDMNDFIKQYFAQRDKEGFVIDMRFNNGGFVQDYMNRILSATLTGFFNQRNSNESWTRQQDYFLGPMVCVSNEFAISCGEEFPHRFRDLKRGPIIGRRTMGGEVGSSPGWPLIDGGVISVPNYGMWTPKDGWVIEGPGVSPDIDVPSDPNAYIQGKDPQLDRSIAWLLEDLQKNPPNRGKQPTVRDRVKGGG